MKTIKKNVYYCDFCHKHRLQAGAIIEHEKHCTLNPARHCRMCDDGPINPEVRVIEHKNSIGPVWLEKEVTINGDECPACVLAFVRQNKITNVLIKFPKNGSVHWDYKAATEKWWEERNREMESEVGYGGDW